MVSASTVPRAAAATDWSARWQNVRVHLCVKAGYETGGNLNKAACVGQEQLGVIA